MSPRPSLRSSPALPIGAIASVVLLVAVLVMGSGILPTALMRDFNAFYCAGRAVDAGADPYLAEPLGACERAPKPLGLQVGMRGLAMPAPLPPYALAPFALLARLPYQDAVGIWTLVLVGAVAATVAAMRRLTGLPYPALIAAFALTDFYASACLGQIAPIAVAAIAVAAACADAASGELAGFACAASMIEPHLGLASCLGLFVRVRSSRTALVASALFAALVSFAVGGIPRMLEYVRRVVPAHALSEVANEKQFSFTHLLFALGVPEARAVHAGEIQFAVMVALGVAIGGRLAVRLRSDGLAVAVPAAFAIVGGPFIHIVQMAAGSVAALALYARLSWRPGRRILALAIVALAIPWIQFVNLGSIFPLLAALVAGILVWTLYDTRPLPLAAIAIGTLVYLIELEALIVEKLRDPVPQLVRAYDPRALAEASWTLYVHLVGTPNRAAYEMAKAPTLFGALAVVTIAVASLSARAARQRKPSV